MFNRQESAAQICGLIKHARYFAFVSVETGRQIPSCICTAFGGGGAVIWFILRPPFHLPLILSPSILSILSLSVLYEWTPPPPRPRSARPHPDPSPGGVVAFSPQLWAYFHRASVSGARGDSAPSSLPTSWFKPPRLIFSFTAALENKRGRRADPLKYPWRRRRTCSPCIIKHVYSCGARHVRAFQRLLSSRVSGEGRRGGCCSHHAAPLRHHMCARFCAANYGGAPADAEGGASLSPVLSLVVRGLEWRPRLLASFTTRSDPSVCFP